MELTIKIEPDNPEGGRTMKITATENYNFVAIEIEGHWFDVPIADLYRATMPFMDMRLEQLKEGS